MNIDLSRFKVVHGDRVMNAIALYEVLWRENEYPGCKDSKTITKPLLLTVLVLNDDGNIVAITDEAWMFQFIPIVTKEC